MEGMFFLVIQLLFNVDNVTFSLTSISEFGLDDRQTSFPLIDGKNLKCNEALFIWGLLESNQLQPYRSDKL